MALRVGGVQGVVIESMKNTCFVRLHVSSIRSLAETAGGVEIPRGYGNIPLGSVLIVGKTYMRTLGKKVDLFPVEPHHHVSIRHRGHILA